MKRRSWFVPVGLLGVAAVIVISFQNCSVRRLQSDGASESGIDNQGADGNGTESGIDNGTDTGIGSGSGSGSGGTVIACMIQDSTQGTIVGLAGQPAIQTSYASVTHQAAIGSLPPSTSVSVIATSVCATKAAFTNPGKCKDTSGQCQKDKMFMVSINLKCDSQSNTATACPNFDDKLNQEIALSDAAFGPYITISVINNTDTCDSSGASQALYMPQLFGAPKVGKVRITKLDGLADGRILSVDLIGVELLKGGTDTGNKLTINGTYAGEVVTTKACTP